jgi:predicted transglutaminase-like cysteine proteinase
LLGIPDVASRFSLGQLCLAVLLALLPLAAPAAREALPAPGVGPGVGMARAGRGEAACEGTPDRGCGLGDWQNLIDRLRGAEATRQLYEVNRAVNRVRYRDDQDNWGRPDYWAAPSEFFARGGDCEDFAIAKYLALRALGHGLEGLRLLVLTDTKRAIAHAVLTVALDGRELVLDNVRGAILPLGNLPHYRIHYSLNERSVVKHLARNR